MTNINYPKPGEEGQLIQRLEFLVTKGYMLEKERVLCLKTEHIPDKILEKVKIRIDLITVHFICN